MPRRCAVPNCLSNSNSKHNTATYISTFLFPSEEEKFKVWMDRINANCNSQISQVKRSTAICIKHFEDKYIVNEARVTRTDGSVLTFPLKRPRLTADAVPTIFSTEKGKKIVRKKYVENSAERIVKEEGNSKEASHCAPVSDLPISFPKKPFRTRTAPSVTVSGVYIIKAEVIKPGPRLIFDESVSIVECDKKEDDAQNVDDLCVKEELSEDVKSFEIG